MQKLQLFLTIFFLLFSTILFSQQRKYSKELENIKENFELKEDSNGYTVVILESEQDSIQQTNSTTKQTNKQTLSRKTNKCFFMGWLLAQA